VDNINLFSILPSELNEYICSFLPEKEYALYDLVSKNFSKPLWPQYLFKRNVKVINGGRAQVLENARTFCNLLLKEQDVKKHLIDTSNIAFKVKETLKELAKDENLFHDFQTALWNIFINEGKNISEGAIKTLLELDVDTFKESYRLYTTQAIKADLTNETFQNFIEKVMSVNFDEPIQYLQVAIEQKKLNAIHLFLKRITNIEPGILNLGLSKKLERKTFESLLEKAKTTNFENIFNSFANGYSEDLILQIVDKLVLFKDGEINLDHYNDLLKREYSQEIIGTIKSIQKHNFQLDDIHIDRSINKHLSYLKTNENKWLNEKHSVELLEKLLRQEIDCKIFCEYYEYKSLSFCYLWSCDRLKEQISAVMPTVTLNLTTDQFILASKSEKLSDIKNLKAALILDIKEAAMDAAAANEFEELFLFGDKSKKKLELKIESTAIRMYGKKTFKLFTEEQKEKKLPLFIVTWQPPEIRKPMAAEAVGFIHNCEFKTIPSFKFYKSTKVENQFKYFCDEQSLMRKINIDSKNNHSNLTIHAIDLKNNPSLRSVNDHAAKFINATNLTLDPVIRGKNRSYVANYYEELAIHYLGEISGNQKKDVQLFNKALKYYTKARFWINCAIEDKDVSAYMAYANWHRVGNLVTPQSKSGFMKHLTLAVEEVDGNDPLAKEILPYYLKILKAGPIIDGQTQIKIDSYTNRIRDLGHT